ncbi:MAG TPA: aspartate aminotransferase family protein [Bacteroidetes bacterium]|nr:aspartate aminotransferase family protein [Bacteroidota bacterium]
MLTHRELFLKYLAQTSDSPLQLEIEKAEGVYLYTPNGKKIIDLISGVSVSNVGHSHNEVVKAVTEQVQKHMHLMVYGEFVQHPQVKLAEAICKMLPQELQSVYFVNSGSEAVEGAIKLAKRYTGRPNIISFKNAYHGGTNGALSLMGCEEFKQAFRPLLPGVKHLTFNNFEDLNRINSSTACVVIEPVQGEAGIIEPQNDFLIALRKRCNETGTLLVFDEIQTGMGRTGKYFAFEKYGVVPDILLLAKAFGGGMPLGAFISSKEIMGKLTHNPVLGHITTFGGHPISCAASLKSLELLTSLNLVDEVEKKEQLFRNLLESHPKVKGIRSSGLFMAVELGSFEKVQKFIRLGLEIGFVTDWFLFCSTAFRIAPPLIISYEEIEQACKKIIQALDRL